MLIASFCTELKVMITYKILLLGFKVGFDQNIVELNYTSAQFLIQEVPVRSNIVLKM